MGDFLGVICNWTLGFLTWSLFKSILLFRISWDLLASWMDFISSTMSLNCWLTAAFEKLNTKFNRESILFSKIHRLAMNSTEKFNFVNWSTNYFLQDISCSISLMGFSRVACRMMKPIACMSFSKKVFLGSLRTGFLSFIDPSLSMRIMLAENAP